MSLKRNHLDVVWGSEYIPVTTDNYNIMVRQPFQWAAVALDYPIYACEFDPTDSGKLIVGGGGGPSRTGVGNKIVGAPTLCCIVDQSNLMGSP